MSDEGNESKVKRMFSRWSLQIIFFPFTFQLQRYFVHFDSFPKNWRFAISKLKKTRTNAFLCVGRCSTKTCHKVSKLHSFFTFKLVASICFGFIDKHYVLKIISGNVCVAKLLHIFWTIFSSIWSFTLQLCVWGTAFLDEWLSQAYANRL